MSSYDAMPPAAWEAIRPCIARPWPKEAAAHDLRWHAARHAIYGRALPSLRDLAETWGESTVGDIKGWTKDRVARLIAKADTWADASRPWAWREKAASVRSEERPDDESAQKNATAPRQHRDSTATLGHGETPRIVAERDTDATAPRQHRDSRADPCLDHPAPCTQQENPPVAPPPAVAGSASAPAAEGVQKPNELSDAPTPKPPKPDPRAELYRVLQAAQPNRSPTPTPTALKAMGVILREAGSPERAGVYLAWVHQSRDEWAQRLRGEAPWPDGSVHRRMSPEELARSLGGRLDAADAWHERGRTEAPLRPTGRAPPGTPRPNPFAEPPRPRSRSSLDLLRELESDADPARHPPRLLGS